MIKSLIASGVAVCASALGTAALAAPTFYFNPEFNGATYDSEYLGGTLTLDLGIKGGEGPYSYYIQGGPAYVMPSGEDGEVEFAGKFGAAVQANDKVSAYAELSGISGEEFGWGSKLGVVYDF